MSAAKSKSGDFLLAVEGLTVSFDGFKAVDDLSFYLDPKEIRVIIGPNGAGKTTVLDLICGKTKATSGSIKFDGKELTKLKEHQIVHSGVGRKFQTPSVFEDLTVFVAETIFLTEALNEPAASLSHGQKQWLEIGMLLIQKPDLLMLDEPVAGMSVTERKKTAELLRVITRDHTVLVIEHDMQFVGDIADRVTVMHQGKVLSEGSIEHVKSDPKVIEVYLGH